MAIHGATSLYSLQSLSKEEERSASGSAAKMSGKGHTGGAPPKKVKRGASLENEYSECDEPSCELKRDLKRDLNRDLNRGLNRDLNRDLNKVRKSDLAEDSDGLWGDDEDDEDYKN